MTKYATLIQQQSAGFMGQEIIVLPNKGFRDPDGFSSYANTIMQCLFHSKAVQNVLSDDPSKSLKQLVGRYENRDSAALECTDNNLVVLLMIVANRILCTICKHLPQSIHHCSLY